MNVPVPPMRRPKTASNAAAHGSAPLLGEEHHGADDQEDEAGPERLDVHEGGAGDHERAECDEDDRHADAGGAEEGVEPVGDRRADDAAVPLQPGDEREEEPGAEQAEPEQLVMVVSALPARALLLANARRRLRAYPRRTLLLRHVQPVRWRRPSLLPRGADEPK